jgi:hypothetical protein
LDADGFGSTGFFHPFDLLFSPAFWFDGGRGAGAVCIDDFEGGQIELSGGGFTCGGGVDSSQGTGEEGFFRLREVLVEFLELTEECGSVVGREA